MMRFEIIPVQRFRRGCIAMAIGSVALIAIVGISAILRSDIGETEARLLYTSLIGLVGSTMLLAAAALYQKKGVYRALAQGSIIAVAATIFVWLAVIWRENPEYDVFVRLAITGSLAAVALTFIGQLLILETRFILLTVAKYAMTALTVFMLALHAGLIWEILPFETANRGGPSRIFLMLILPTTLLSVLGLLFVPLVIRLVERGVITKAESIPMKLLLRMTCPSCGERQEFRYGPVRCAHCQRHILIEIEEPRCECGYLLYQLTSAVCPECGRPVPRELRWHEVTGETSALDRQESRPGSPE